MKLGSSPLPLPAAVGKVITSAQIVSDAQDVHGVLLMFTDGTELSIDFFYKSVTAEIRHYQWDANGESVTVGGEEPSPTQLVRD